MGTHDTPTFAGWWRGADIEARALRLVSNYGFIEDPSLMIRATRYRARLGWELDPKTQTRYENAKNDDVIQYLSEEARSRELGGAGLGLAIAQWIVQLHKGSLTVNSQLGKGSVFQLHLPAEHSHELPKLAGKP